MSIRIRVVDGVTVALCAARSVPKDGDIYLDDAAHEALAGKFATDFASEGRMFPWANPRLFPLADPHAALREREESNNPNREWWDKTYVAARTLPRDDTFPPSDVPADDHYVGWMEKSPYTWRPGNPYYVKTHVNAPGTVRAWFRQMRAADFKRDKKLWTAMSRGYAGVSRDWVRGLDDGRAFTYFYWFKPYPEGVWTLFDTQQVVDRETAWVYQKFEIADILFVNDDGHVVGRIRNVAIERSAYPPLASQVPTSSRGISDVDLRRFVREDDNRRWERR